MTVKNKNFETFIMKEGLLHCPMVLHLVQGLPYLLTSYQFRFIEFMYNRRDVFSV